VRITSHHDIGAYADIVVEFMDALGIDKAWVLGSSIGGFVCADLGIRHADRMLGVVMVEAALRPATEWEAQWTVVEQLFGEAVQTLDQVAPRFRAFTREHLFRWNVDRAKAGVWVMMDVMWAIRQYDLVAALPKIESPVALIFGDRGPVTAGIPGYVKALPDAPRHILDNCGHFPMIDDPDAFLKATFASLDHLAARKR
jgi:3-oxoadipate enol-lactonase